MIFEDMIFEARSKIELANPIGAMLEIVKFYNHKKFVTILECLDKMQYSGERITDYEAALQKRIFEWILSIDEQEAQEIINLF
jgi:hypothetical protein